MDITHLRAKTCTKCGEVKPVSEFYKKKQSFDSYCKICRCFCVAKYQEEHREELYTQQSVYRSTRKELDSVRWAKHCKDNVAYYRAKAMKRVIAKRQASVKWANADAVLAIYELAVGLELLTGIKHHVDHIVPLQHPLVCGLHWEGNLQVLTAEENIKKSNKFTPG